MRRLIITTLLTLSVGMVAAQGLIEVRAEAQATASTGDHEPLWLSANKYGLSSIKTTNGYVRAGAFRSLAQDSTRKWGWGAGADMAVASRFTSTMVVQQLYGEVRWHRMVLTVGSKEQPVELKNQELSSGAQTLGVNARPVPAVRLSMPDYWSIPGTRNWLAIKGHMSYGRYTDDKWQKEFTNKESRYIEGQLLHTKAGYMRIGPGRINFELGLEMACQFGGTSYMKDKEDRVLTNAANAKAFMNALLVGGSDVTDGDYKNTAGNHLGSWVARLNIDREKWNLGLYVDQFFEDNSMMVHIAYNGWGSGDQGHQHVKSRYFIYDFKDALLGAELKLKENPWLDHIVLEYMYTKYQGGPVYHDVTNVDGEHITGRDNYYNHHLFTGWQHWGMVMGNPLYLSPLYNEDGKITIHNNRFTAWHLGLSGQPLEGLHYRVLATYQHSFGTYVRIYPDPKNQVSLLAEADYRFPVRSKLAGWRVKGALGLDSGDLLGDNFGVQLTLGRSLWIDKRK